MAASLCSSSSNSSCSSLSPAPHPPHHHPFTPIQECEREGKEEDDDDDDQKTVKLTTASNSTPPPPHNLSSPENNINYVHQPTPLHSTKKKKRPESSKDRGVSCNKCRPNISSSRDKFSVVPLDTAGRLSITSPNALFKSIFSSVKKSPASSSSTSSKSAHQGSITPPASSKLEWKNHRAVAAELSQKLIHATKKRDEAILEASRLKSSVTQLEKKLNKLEIYCHNLRSGLDDCANHNNNHHEPIKIGDHDRVIEHFLVAVSESRSSMRHLTRSLTAQQQLPQTQGLYDRIHQHLLLQPPPNNPRVLVFYLEALLNRAFFQDFESPGFLRSGPNRTLNPIHRCQSNFDSFTRLKELTWEEVLNKGTKQFSEEFSRFCDRKMSEVVTMLGWTRPWPEPLLQAFFGASKSVWLVHLLANSLHPSLPIFRVDKGVPFDSVYMEDFMGGGDKSKKTSTVRVMVEPGFYIYGNVVKCKVICRYHSHTPGLTNVSPNTNPS